VADINAMIAQGAQPVRLESPINMMAQMSQLQAAQGANQLRQMQMEQAMRQQEQENALARLPYETLSATPQAALQYGAPGRAMYGELLKGAKERREAELASARVAAENIKTAQFGLRSVDSPESYAAWRENTSRMLPGVASSLPAAYSPEAVMRLSLDAEKLYEQVTNIVNAGTTQQIVQTPRYGGPATVVGAVPVTPTALQRAQTEAALASAAEAGTPASIREFRNFQNMTPEQQDEFIRLQAAKRPTTTIDMPVPVVDPKTGRVIYVPREQAVGQTPPQFMEGMTPRERQQREAKLPSARQALSAFESKSDKLIDQVGELMNHPGLNQITGLVGGRIVGITDAGRRAEALYNSIIAQGGFSELQALRDASTTGGALGNVSNREGEQLRDAFGVLKRTQSLEDFKRGLADVQRSLLSAKTRTREVFEDTYAYREDLGQKPTAPAPAPTPAAPAAAPARPAATSRSVPPVPSTFTADPELWKYMSDEDRKLWTK
jgi:hypothetical protein